MVRCAIGIVLLGVAGRNFLAVDAALEDFDGRRVVGRKLGERHEFLGQMRDERGLDERRLDQFFKHRAGDFIIHIFLADFRAEIVCTLAAFGGRNVEPICPGFFADEVLVFGASPWTL